MTQNTLQQRPQQRCILEDCESKEGKTLEYSISKNSGLEVSSQNW